MKLQQWLTSAHSLCFEIEKSFKEPENPKLDEQKIVFFSDSFSCGCKIDYLSESEKGCRAGCAPGAAPRPTSFHKWATCEKAAQVESDSYLINLSRLNLSFLTFQSFLRLLHGVKSTVKLPPPGMLSVVASIAVRERIMKLLKRKKRGKMILFHFRRPGGTRAAQTEAGGFCSTAIDRAPEWDLASEDGLILACEDVSLQVAVWGEAPPPCQLCAGADASVQMPAVRARRRIDATVPSLAVCSAASRGAALWLLSFEAL